MPVRAEPVGLGGDDANAVDRLRAASDSILEECGKVIVGQKDVMELLLIALLSQGHTLLVGVPGLAKTLMIRTLADSMNLTFNRVQFTPDLIPTDITGTRMIEDDPETHRPVFKFLPGPLFANVVLADEVNRTPPKTQSALLEAMQEKQVTVAGVRHALPEPFFVLATQNPIEQEGTYPLPEAQQDRFMFTVSVGYPSEEDEYRIIEATTSAARPHPNRVVGGEELLEMQRLVRKVPAAGFVIRYAMKLARLTRPGGQDGEPADPNVPDFVKKYVTWGAGPRAGQNLILAAKARALLRGRTYVATEDVKAVALPVLRHRVVTNYNADADRVTPDEIVRKLLALVPARAQE
ncbi:AAA family ATPase [Frigoriglobus tundricola]|uniref:ATPase, MoxR family n=1 Tax=Frigoriglobus tundricola TaxID=2774151 RepID=A0A6M5YWV3_9BACT|nr:MoxR family ATPase [Frigoriglobus tundricola]QJW97771.1 ATPase, MoxR family [Frigoriglobus tundricola]